MRIKYCFLVNSATNEKRVYVSDVLAMYECKVSLFKKTKVYLVLQNEPYAAEEPTNWIRVNKFISNFYNDVGSLHFYLKMFNLKCY